MRQILTQKQLAAFCLVFLLILFAAPTAAFADQPDPIGPGDEVCTMCHWSETSQWQHSPHANNGVACEECHGDYTQGHPDETGMVLPMESLICQDCHEETHNQWSQSAHADAGIECIDCHVPHSQTTRLNSEELCVACHDDDVGMTWDQTAHKIAGLTCVDCHILAPPPVDGVTTGAHDHSFTVVPSHLCINCHADNLHEVATKPVGDGASDAKLASYSDQTEALNQQLQEAEEQNNTLQNWTLIALGLGLGIGLFLGLVLMLSLSFVSSRSEKKS